MKDYICRNELCPVCKKQDLLITGELRQGKSIYFTAYCDSCGWVLSSTFVDTFIPKFFDDWDAQVQYFKVLFPC